MKMPLTKNNLYSDNEVFCGGVGQQFKKNKGKCGVCGDDWSAKRPRLNENGGTWGTGTIGKTYFQGQVRILKVTRSRKEFDTYLVCDIEPPIHQFF